MRRVKHSLNLVPCRLHDPTTISLGSQIQHRKFPHSTRQLWLLLRRGMVKYIRAFWPLRIIDSLLLLLSAFIIGRRNPEMMRLCMSGWKQHQTVIPLLP